MLSDRYRVLFVCSHPVQYASPIFRRMAQHPKLDIQVAYCSLQGAEAALDYDFGIEVRWDVPLLEGYSWAHVPNRSPRARLGRFFGLINPGLWRLFRSGRYDAVVIYTGYRYASFWIALAAAKLHHTPVLFGTDANGLAAQNGAGWKMAVKRRIWPHLFALADAVIVPSTPSAEMMQALGLPPSQIFLTPYVVDNDWWTEQAAQVDRAAVRRGWGIPQRAPVVLFCAKLQPWKRPLDLLHAFAQSDVAGAHLVYAGEGPLRADIESRAAALGLGERVRFLGFVNQSRLPAVYGASDVLVLPSEYEPFGVVVNEAMLCGCAAIVSHQVGAGHDLVAPGSNGYVFPAGNVEALAARLREALSSPEKLSAMSDAARKRMQTWSPAQNIAGLLQAIACACRGQAHPAPAARETHSPV